MKASECLKSAWAASRRTWAAFVVLAAGSLLLSALVVSPAGITLFQTLGHRPILATLAGYAWPNATVDLALASVSEQGNGAFGTASLIPAALSGNTAFLVAIALVLEWLLYTFTSAAMLGRISAGQAYRQPSAFSPHIPAPADYGVVSLPTREGPLSLWQCGWHWFAPMARLGLVSSFLGLLLAVIAGFALGRIFSDNPGGLVGRGIVFLVWMGALNSLFELARTDIVRRSDRSARQAVLDALHALTTRPLPVLVLWLILGVGSFAIQLFLIAVILFVGPAVPAVSWLVPLLTVSLGSGYKLFRLAAQSQLLA